MSVLVESANKGGLLVKYGIYDGFVPVSQFGSVSDAANGNGAGNLHILPRLHNLSALELHA